MISLSTATNTLHKLMHGAWIHPPQAAIDEMARIKERLFETIDPLFEAETHFAERLVEPEAEVASTTSTTR